MAGKGSVRRPDTLARELAPPIAVAILPAKCDTMSRLWTKRPCLGAVWKLAPRVPAPDIAEVGACQWCGQRYIVRESL